jgi:ABC-type transport system involved in cytochrome bd biosynthesis fused ATPase/permease subunit
MHLDAAVPYFVLFCIYAVFITALVGFIIVQIKARPIWRLLSLTVVVVGSCWFSSCSTRETLENQFSEYARGSAEFLEAIDQLSIQGRTNDVHQACQNFPFYLVLLPDKQYVSNFDQFVANTEELASKPPNKSLQPTATAPLVSTNK